MISTQLSSISNLIFRERVVSISVKQTSIPNLECYNTVCLGYERKKGSIILFFKESLTLLNNVPYCFVIQGMQHCKSLFVPIPLSNNNTCLYSYICVLGGTYCRSPAINLWNFACLCRMNHLCSFGFRHALGHNVNVSQGSTAGFFHEL